MKRKIRKAKTRATVGGTSQSAFASVDRSSIDQSKPSAESKDKDAEETSKSKKD